MEDEYKVPDEGRLRYIERRKKDVECLRSALLAKNLDEFQRIGHQIKGHAASFGYSDLEKVAVQMEAAATRQDLVEAARQLALFEHWLARVSST
jgi:HPt (histidine-containing phosphotransfer) domain-containing protein